jgi:hypothetical protein
MSVTRRELVIGSGAMLAGLVLPTNEAQAGGFASAKTLASAASRLLKYLDLDLVVDLGQLAGGLLRSTQQAIDSMRGKGFRSVERVTVSESGSFSVAVVEGRNPGSGERSVSIAQDTSCPGQYASIENAALYALEVVASDLRKKRGLSALDLQKIFLPIADCSGRQQVWRSSAPGASGDTTYNTQVGTVRVNGEIRDEKNGRKIELRVDLLGKWTYGDGTTDAGNSFRVTPLKIPRGNLQFA